MSKSKSPAFSKNIYFSTLPKTLLGFLCLFFVDILLALKAKKYILLATAAFGWHIKKLSPSHMHGKRTIKLDKKKKNIFALILLDDLLQDKHFI